MSPSNDVIVPTTTSTNTFGQSFLEETGIVASLPPISRIDDVILNADVFEISSMIQNIVSFNQNCDRKLPYLQQVVQRINEHLDYNRDLIAQEQQRITDAQSNLRELEQERESIRQQLSNFSNRTAL